MDLLREKEADWEAERRRLARMGAFLHNAKDKMALAQTVRPGEIRLETFPEAHCAVVEAPDFAHAKFEEAVYLLHVRQLITWARENGSPSQAPGDIICRESLERGDFMEDYYYCLVPPGTTGWPLRVRPAGTYAVLYHQGSYASEYGACRRLRDWVLAQGYAIDGDLYEEDLVNDIASEDPRSYLLKLSLKIKKPPPPGGGFFVLLQGRERVLKKKLPQEEGNFIRTGREREFEKVYFFKLLYRKSTY